MRRLWLAMLGVLLVVACSDTPVTPDARGPLFPPRPECEGSQIDPLAGDHKMVISTLEIGSKEDGFDLDGDGDPDNKLAGVGSLARSAIQDSFESFEIIISIEFFDFPQAVADECVKFAMYAGKYRLDRDGDGRETARSSGDCNDHEPTINHGLAEVADNGRDDDCDGRADETTETIETDAGTQTVEVPSTNTDDADGDGVTIADGDCDDTLAAVKWGIPEVCGDGLDNNCDGSADWGEDASTTPPTPMCSPYDLLGPDTVVLDPLSFETDGSPVIAFHAGSTSLDAGALNLEAGPSLFSVTIPVTGDLNLELRITGTTIYGEIIETGSDLGITAGRLGGVLDANSMDKVTGLEVDEIGLSPEDTLLDATYANLLGTIIGLPKPQDGCMAPDIDVDGDGIEMFCDMDFEGTVELCIDGDGTMYYDDVATGKNCTEEIDEEGNLRFQDGISVEMNFEAVPVLLEGAP